MSIQSPKPLPRHRREKMSAAASTEHGVAAPDVARRCERVADASAKALIWWLQAASYRTGGLKAVAQQLVADNPNACLSKELATANPDQLGQRVRPSVEGRLRLGCGADYDLLGALSDSDADLDTDPAYWPTLDKLIADIRLETVGRLTEYLLDLCLNPRRELVNDEPGYFGGLRSALARLAEGRSAALRPAVVQTAVAGSVADAFGYALRTRSLVVVNGPARIGKTFSGRAWCEQNPGLARYAQVPSSSDELSFFRVLAHSLGVPFSFGAKVVELRSQIEEVLQRGDLLLCLDEAHYLWPQSAKVAALPKRISWLMTAVLNYQVPVVALTTPQFFHHLQRIEDGSFWTSHQFTGRIGKFVQLPDEVRPEDLAAVARHILPELSDRDLKALVAVAVSTRRYLAAIDAAVKAARDCAALAGRERVTSDDVKRAIGESVLPSDTALAAVLERRTKPSKRLRSVPASPVPATGLADAEPLQPRAVRPTGFDLPTPSAPQRGGILAEA